MDPQRVLYSESKPYELPERLDDLRGPESGVLELPVTVYWGPDSTVDLGTAGGIEKAYQCVIQEGRVHDLVAILHPLRLREVWPDLLLPRRARDEWEARFPELSR